MRDDIGHRRVVARMPIVGQEAIAQLGQLGDRGRWRFGRGTLALTIVIVGALTYFPLLSLGPYVEQLLMNAGKVF